MKILFLTDSYYTFPTANGICVDQIAREFQREGNEIHVLCFRKGQDKAYMEADGIKTFRLKMNWTNRLRFLSETSDSDRVKLAAKRAMILVNRIQAMLCLGLYPMRTPVFCYRYYRAALKLQKENQYDLIIASYSPFEAAYAAYRVKKKVTDVRICMYTLDSLSNKSQAFFMSKEWQDQKGWKWEQKFYPVYDLILNLRCHSRHYAKPRYQVFADKMDIVDIPHMIKREYTEPKEKGQEINIVYAGVLRPVMTEYFLELFERMLSWGDFRLHIYGRSTVEHIMGRCSEETLTHICFHGFVEHSEALEAERNADILLNMGNIDSDFIPSKIFEYISMGRKVLHIYKDDTDSALPYMQRYPKSCNVSILANKEENLKEIHEFVRKEDKRYTYDELAAMFEENVPAYTVGMIKDYLGIRRES